MKNVVFIFVILVIITFIAQSTMAQQNLVLYLPFDEGSGTTVKDLSGNGNNGTINGAVKWTDGKINKAIQINGKSFVDIPNSDTLSPEQNITVMAWVNMDKSSSGEMAIVSKGQWAANDLPYELTVTPGGKIFWQMYDDSGRDGCQPPSPAVGEWHHLAGTYDGKTFTCYIDGVNAMTYVYAGKLPKNTANVTVGKRSKADECYFNGIIDEVAVFASTLSDKEVADAMNGIKAAAVNAKEKLPALWGKIKSE